MPPIKPTKLFHGHSFNLKKLENSGNLHRVGLMNLLIRACQLNHQLLCHIKIKNLEHFFFVHSIPQWPHSPTSFADNRNIGCEQMPKIKLTQRRLCFIYFILIALICSNQNQISCSHQRESQILLSENYLKYKKKKPSGINFFFLRQSL